MAALIVLIVVLLVLFGIGWIFFRFTFTREGFAMPGKQRVTEEQPDLRSWKKYQIRHEDDYAWYCRQTMEEVRITSDDGLTLYGQYLSCNQPERLVICVHGYRGIPAHDFAGQGRWLHEEHCDLLFITQRGSGKSEGRYITFGAREKLDVRAWARYAAGRNPDLPVYLYGISMGCTTVLLSSVTGLPDQVKGIIADCGFSSARNILAAQCRQAFHLPPVPMLWFLEFYCILIGKFRFSEADACGILSGNRIPVLFFHGEEDHFVYPENSRKNYAACGAPKELFLIEHAVHASAYYENTALYQERVRRLFYGRIGEQV